MLTKILESWSGTYDMVSAPNQSSTFHVVLKPLGKTEPTEHQTAVAVDDSAIQYRIAVKRYMTQPATPRFDFMAKWNNNKPMPLRVMVGEKIKETRGMVYMSLHGDIVSDIVPICMKCGKPLTNPVSQYFGMGPECGSHNYVNPFNSDEELHEAVESYRKKLNDVVWEGWVIKSAIEEMEVVE